MTPRFCPRCRAVLHREDEGALVYCWNCGAPQVQLSEELRDQIDQQITAQQAAANPLGSPAPQAAPPSNAIIWRGAIQCAGLAGAVAAALALLSFAVPPIALLSFFWFVAAPIVVLGVYSSRFRKTRITAGFGARLGLLAALAMVLVTSTFDTVGLIFERFVFHSTAEIDTQVNNLFVQMHTNFSTQPGPVAKAAIDMLAIPEFRAGLLLASFALCLGIYLAYSATAGAFAGYLRSRSPRP